MIKINSYVLKIALSYLKSKKYKFLPSLNTSLCIITITLSVFSLVVVKSVMNGFRKELIESIIGINSHLNLYPRQQISSKEYSKDISSIKNLPSFKDKILVISPTINSTGMITNGQKSNGIFIKGIDKPNEMKLRSQRIEINGNIVKFTKEKDVIMIGQELALQLRIKIGDKVNITIPKIIKTMFGSFPVSKDFTIVGIVKTGTTDYDSTICMIKNSTLVEMFNYPQGTISNIEIFLKNYNESKKLLQEILPYKERYRITDWEMENYGLINALKTEAGVMSIILSLFILITMVGVFMSMLNTVRQKEREIGIMHSMGMYKNEILSVFFINSIITTVTGLILGLATGIPFAYKINKIKIYLEKLFNITLFDGSIYLLSSLPSQIVINDILYAVFLVLFFGILFAIIPARNAIEKRPADILRSFH